MLSTAHCVVADRPSIFLVAGFRPRIPFCVWCVLSTPNSSPFPICTAKSELGSIYACFQWMGSIPAGFPAAFRAVWISCNLREFDVMGQICICVGTECCEGWILGWFLVLCVYVCLCVCAYVRKRKSERESASERETKRKREKEKERKGKIERGRKQRETNTERERKTEKQRGREGDQGRERVS